MDVIDEKGLLNENPNVIVQDSFPNDTHAIVPETPMLCPVYFL